MSPNNIQPNQSMFVDLLKFLRTIKGDLANITAPPSFLAASSVVENPRCWAERPKVFAGPALEADTQKRSLAILKLFLVGLRSQLYIAGSPGVSIKKPLNAFLGELFLASWTDGNCTTKLVSEQVSHHPPITAVHIEDKDSGIRADGYARVEMTFSSTVNIRQVGHSIVHIDKYDEDYLMPFPDVQVRGLLSACFYPEIVGSYRIISSNGFISEIKFSGAGFIHGKRNQFEAVTFHESEPKVHIYEVSGVWSEEWIVKDGRTGEVLEVYRVDDPENGPVAMDIQPAQDQDPWESRRAWRDVIRELEQGNVRAAAAAKHALEEGQRRMRRVEKKRGEDWQPLFFQSLPGTDHQAFHRLTRGTDWALIDSETKGVWRIRDDIDNFQRPFRGESTPISIQT
ncbi:hypothetical protein BGZ63DRAFT_429130 [Mariannaea sp. PMI_226]|nr:hypothetical protein BGZ63DRAFT_429130 [Mariannaea sp. PMI_226]